MTRDVDLTILLPPGREEPVLAEIIGTFPARVDDPVAFALEHRVLPVSAPGASDADIVLGLPGYEEGLTSRATHFQLEPGRSVRLCSAEDLAVHKALAGRPRDLQDLEGIVLRQGTRLDVSYIRRWLADLARAAEDPEVLARFERTWAAVPTAPACGAGG